MSKRLNALIIDHYDSFTYNVKEWLTSAGMDVTVAKWDEELANSADYNLIVLSPGPGSPSEYQKTARFIESNIGKTPIFGICLGMQLLLSQEGNAVKQVPLPTHGKVSKIELSNSSFLFEGIGPSLSVGRYHSLGVESGSGYEVTAKLDDLVMAIENEGKMAMGVQFHPESFLTESREQLLSNIKNKVLEWTSHH